MSYGKLSHPLLLKGSNNFQLINHAKKIFEEIFIKQKSRPNLDGVFIFFDINAIVNSKTLSLPERFMHICSIIDKHNYTAFPCQNDITYSQCFNKCSITKALTDFQFIQRTECLFRASRIHWIPEIIRLANSNHNCIKSWATSERSRNGKSIIKKRYIRYEEESVDYVIILQEVWKYKTFSHYKFITAFPVFLKRNKIQFEQEYTTYLTNQPQKIVPVK